MSGAIIFHLFTLLGIVHAEFNEVGDIVGNDWWFVVWYGVFGLAVARLF